MPYVLGIDTGGTYTDGVLIDLEKSLVIAKAKAFTTRADLTVGINDCLSKIPSKDLQQVKLVVLSTTLATNAIVEGRGCRAGLLLIGQRPEGRLPVAKIEIVTGGHNLKGEAMAPLDSNEVRQAIARLKEHVDTLAISGYLSIRNPEHEEMARRWVREEWDIPVVCAHQLSTALGFYERTVTACLNARLLPVIAELMTAVKLVIREKGINARLMIVRGDGSLMSETIARERPVETILSGPAASIVGAVSLSGVKKAVVLDMGGTTTDIAILENGRPTLNKEGATVGGWRTRVEAADINTFGLGGDSYLQVFRERKLAIGPQRVWPLAVAGEHYPYLAQELAAVDPYREVYDGQATDCWMLIRHPREQNRWSDSEWQVVNALSHGAHTVFTLADILGMNVEMLPLKGLEQEQIIGRISLTPTDVLHALGKFTAWDKQAASIGCRILARYLGIELNEFLDWALHEIEASLQCTILQTLLNRQGIKVDLKNDIGAKVFLQRVLSHQMENGFGVNVQLDYPVVAIGAPSSAYLPVVKDVFHTQVYIPEHAEVANAVGAALGQVVETVRLIIKPGDKDGFVVHAPFGRVCFLRLDEAEKYALEKAKAIVHEKARLAGISDPEILVQHDKRLGRIAIGDEKIFVETFLEVTAIGRPHWE